MKPKESALVPEKSKLPSPRARRQSVQAASTGVTVLKGLARLGGRASLTALAAHVNENPAKVHRYLVSLIEGGLVAQDTNSQQYRLDLEAMLIGVAAMRQSDPVRIAESSLIQLRESLEVTCFVAVMGNKGPTIVRFEEPGLPVTVNVRVGSVLSMLWSATGRVFLGLLDEPRVRALAQEEFAALAPEQRKKISFDDFLAELHQELSTANCSVVKDTNLKGISAVAAPIYNYAGQLSAVLTALGATGGFDSSLDGDVAVAVRREAMAASALLGYRKE